MALASPGIQLFESSVTPATTVAAAENGVASLGYSTRGPVNKLTRIRSVSEFNEVFGKPIADYPFAHIMGQSVLANGTDFYFMRLADSSAEKASCPVVDYQPKGARVAVKDNTDTGATAGYFMASITDRSSNPVTSLDRSVYLRVSVAGVNVDTEMQLAVGGIGYNTNTVIYTSIVSVINNLSRELPKFSFTAVNSDTEIGILVVAKNDTDYKDTDLVFSVDVGSIENETWQSWVDGGSSVYEVTKNPTAMVEGTFKGETLSKKSTLATMGNIANYNHFELVAKYPGSSMNGIRVTKDSTVSSVDPSAETWTVTVYDGANVVESRGGITADTFIEEMTKFEYIEITDEALGTGKDVWTWHDGSWDLGLGELLSNGDHWTQEWGGTPYEINKGTDGYPTITIGGQPQYDEDQSVNLYIEGLGSDEFVNTDEFSFSILATPGMQNTMVQNAAIDVCATRGDAIFLADVPMQLCESKQLIDEVVEWANGNSGFQSSYCAIYYGWFAQTNPYDTANSIFCPASCFIAPKMAALDQSMGEFYAPAGIARGGVVCSDYIYSPDQKDRDKLVGNDNVVNPISYSNTRGVTIMAQKTTDRTTSPLNRVGIRRMTNMIKRKLKSQLVALLFEPNNETARSRARTMVDGVMASLRSKECVESYDINVVSGTGANRNDLNVYLSFAPYGLIEKIYVYLSITDAGVETSETIA